MAQEKQGIQAQNTAQQRGPQGPDPTPGRPLRSPLPRTGPSPLLYDGYGNGGDLSIAGNAARPRRRWWRRRAGIIGIVGVLLVVLAAGSLYMLRNQQSPPSYQYGSVTQGDLALTIDATGPLQSPATYNLVAATSGIIEKIDVKVGQKVTRGQVLAELNKTALQDAVNQAQAAVNADQDALYNTEVSTGWVVTPAVTQAEDTLKIAQAQLAAARHNLDNATLRAPHAGVVTAINGTVGGTPGTPLNAGSGASGGNYFIQIVDLSSLQIVANVNESDTANLKVGDPVLFTVDAYGDRQFKGVVDAISPDGVASSNVVSYPVIIDVDTQSVQGANLLPGMTAAVTITVLQRSNALVIPVSAISFARTVSSGNAAGGAGQLVSQQAVNTAMSQARQMLSGAKHDSAAIAAESPTAAFVLEQSGGRYIAKPVVLGITDGTSYEVLSGLSLNETILVGTGGPGSAPNASPSNSGSSGKGG
jgi:HlyD family secretion protein